jgi:hypothetical protein
MQFVYLNALEMKLLFSIFFLVFATTCANAQPQTKKIAVYVLDGIAAAGYVDHGAYLNFTGPNVSYTRGKSKLIFGMLPSLRFKLDSGATKNSPIFPSLGVGLTYAYKKLVVQVPLYYNAKTSTTNGKWNVGVGLGYRFK